MKDLGYNKDDFLDLSNNILETTICGGFKSCPVIIRVDAADEDTSRGALVVDMFEKDPKLILHNNKTKLEYIGYIQFKENYNCTWQGLAERGSLACHSNRAALLA